MPERLESEVNRLRRENETLRQTLIERDKKIAELGKEVADLERQLGLRRQNETTSPKLPSSDELAGEQRKRRNLRKKSQRKPGSQPEHRGRWRGLAPLSRVDRRLSRKMSTQSEERRHQITELPPIAAHH